MVDIPSINELVQLKQQSHQAQRDRNYKYGRVGVKNTSGNWVIPEVGMRYITVTLEEGTLLREVDSRGINAPGLEVRLTMIAGRWIIEGEDQRQSNLTVTNESAALPKHNHNIGYTSFFPIDPATINEGMVRPTGSGLNVVIGRVTYPKLNGDLGIYDDADTLDLASGVSGLTAMTARWVVLYIDKSDGTANFHVSATETPPLNTTTHIENALADCIATVPNAYPFQVVKMSAGLSAFGTYKPMSGLSMDTKDFIRLGNISGSGASSNNSNTIDGDRIIPSGKDAFFAGNLNIISGTLTIVGELYVL